MKEVNYILQSWDPKEQVYCSFAEFICEQTAVDSLEEKQQIAPHKNWRIIKKTTVSEQLLITPKGRRICTDACF
jgi:hypothetical protein